MVTLAIHKRMRRWLFGNVERSILEYEQRGVRTSQGCKEAVIENLASNWMKKKEKKDVGEVKLTNGIIQGDAFSPLLFVLMIDPLIKVLKRRLGDHAEVLYYMDDLKASMTDIHIAQTINGL